MEMININKPKFELRDLKGGTLDNGVKYVIVTDKSLQKSFVSVSVHAGSYQNPKGYDGLAHFLEHMLFMGSKKYPNENHYSERLNELGGYSNAYTDVMETVYYFSVFDDGLEEIIDIFSRFFIDPLFNPDSVNREINAVDSEHQKNINSDMWRKHQFIFDLANTNSPINTFISGSSKTLAKLNIRDKVIEFYNKYYTSNNISLCIASAKEPTEIHQILNKTFGTIQKSTVTNNKLIVNKPAYSKNIEKTFHLKSTSNKYDVSYVYEIPFQDTYLETKEFTLLDMILSEKSETSLYFHLKNLGYLNSINTETRFEGLFIITMSLTKEGFANMQHCEHLLFDTLGKIFTMDIESVANYFKQILDVNFNCLNKFDAENLSNTLAVNHLYYKTENVFEGTFKMFKLNTASEYFDLYKKHINSNNLIKIIHSKEFANTSEHKYLTDKHYNYEYTEFNFKLDDSYSHGIEINLDTKNDYLNAEPSIVPDIDRFEVPTLIGEKQWYGGCSEFGEPTVSIWMNLNNPKYFSNTKNYLLTQISCSVLNFLIGVIMYKPQQLCYTIYFEPAASLSCINIHVTALNDFSKLQILLAQLKEFIINVDQHFKKIDERFTNNLIVTYKESYQNIKFLNPSDYLSYIIKSTITKTECTHDELLKQINSITYADIENHVSSLFEGSCLTTLTYGNIEIKNGTNLFDKFSKLFFNPTNPLPVIKPIDDMNLKHPNPIEKSHVISYFYRVGKFTPRDYGQMLVLDKIVSEKFFDILRTKHQLGYLVRFGLSIYRDEYYLSERIQSGKSVETVKEKIDEFNENIIKYIKESAFEQFIETVKKELDEPDYSLSDKINRYRPEIAIRTYLFNRYKLVKDQLNNLTKSDIIEFAQRVISSTNKKVLVVNGN